MNGAHRPLLLLVFAAMCTGASSCSCGDVDGPGDGEGTLDVPLGAGEVRCGRVTRASELIGGPGAYGQVGRVYRCYNNRIRFLVQDGSRPVGNSSLGGNLIDVDLVRADETSPGQDAFRELVVAYGGKEVVPERVEVVSDGRGESLGVLRVSGRPAPITIVPQAHYLGQDMPARIETDYILRPDVAHIEIRTRIINESDDFIGPVLYADFLSFGGEGVMHTPEYGYGAPALFSRATFTASEGGPGVSYGYVCSDADLTLPLVDGNISAPVCRDDVQVALEESYSRYLLVGDGTLESITVAAMQLRELSTGVLTGKVSAGDGSPAINVDVAALEGGDPDDEDARVINRARTDTEGRYHLTLRPGGYRVVAISPVGTRSSVEELEVTSGAALSRDLSLGQEGVLRVTTQFQSAGGEALPLLAAKLSVLPLGDTPVPSAALHESRRYGLRRYRPSVDGAFSERLPVGRYRVYVSRGFEFSRFEQEVEVTSTAATEVTATLVHQLDTTGLLGAEFHQHSLASVDANVPLAVKVTENAAEGVEVAASTDHDNVADFRPVVEAVGLANQLLVMAGNEVSYNAIGHFNVYPWDIDADDPLRDIGSRVWWQKTIPELFADLRELAGDPVIQVNHPRSSTAGYFGAMLWNPSKGETEERGPPGLPSLPPTIYEEWSDDFEALEVNDSLGTVEDFTVAGWEILGQRAAVDPGAIPVLADWFALLGKGVHVAAMGNSDSHEFNGGVGYPRNFLRIGVDAPTGTSYAAVREAIRAQHVSVGNGCLAQLWAGAVRPMGVSEAVSPSALSTLRLHIQAPAYVAVDSLEVYANGMAQSLSLTDEAVLVEAEGALSLGLSPARRVGAVVLDAPLVGLPAGDLVVVAIARGSGTLRPTGDGGPYCITAPLYVDEGGDGWRGWLEGTTP